MHCLNTNTTSSTHTNKAKMKHNILMVSDFFFPGFGGVESHLYNLSQCLIKRGHKVIMMTRAYGNRSGVRYITNGLKVYYIPILGVQLPPGTVTLPQLFGFFPLFRDIVIRERITIVHGHQATSTLCHEAMQHARTMGLRCTFTDHSLFGFADAACIHINKVLKYSLSDVDHVICVSHTSKENTVLRAAMNPLHCSVIPNAVDTSLFTPASGVRTSHSGPITIVVMTRLVYRKGVDLLAHVIPEICRRFPQVNFIVGGDGPRRLQMEEMREKHQLFDRVEMLGEVSHADVRNVLVRGQLFLNCSLTEAFCIAILEAASCGLLVVSTKVGGVPEVLPPHMIVMAEPDPSDIVRAVCEALPMIKNVNPVEFHESIKSFYSWDNVAERTERVYDKISQLPPDPLIERLRRYHNCGRFFGKILTLMSGIDYLIWRGLEWMYPASDIDLAIDFPHDYYEKVKDSSFLQQP